MNTEIKDGTLVIYLGDHIDTNNAPEWEKDIMAAIEANEGKHVNFDAEKLEYISSSGLRVLMKAIKKLKQDAEITNVSRDVYEIFDITGFTNMFDIKKALREMSIEGLTLIGSGFTGDVYRLDDETVLKVFHKNVDYNTMISKENEKAHNAFLAGIPTAIPYDIVKVGDCYGTVYELLNAKDMVNVIEDDKEHLEDYIRNFAETVRKMHDIKIEDDKFESVRGNSMKGLPWLASILSEDELSKVKAFYENIPERDTFIHGDCHLGNVMVQDGEMMFIDLATAGKGHPIFDLTSMYSVFVDRPKAAAYMPPSPLLEPFTSEEIEKIWKLFLSSYLGTDDEELLKKAERQIEMVSYARRLFMPIALPGAMPMDAYNAMKQKLIDYIDEGLEEICF
ncbi:TIGR02172 family protein [Lachnospiraceae bacterium NE2001]|nr:TIGR02172 family protein [Lachnospiraceae bacterium NE2001]